MKFLDRAKQSAEQDTVDAFRAVGSEEIGVWRATFVKPDESVYFVVYAFHRMHLRSLSDDLWMLEDGCGCLIAKMQMPKAYVEGLPEFSRTLLEE